MSDPFAALKARLSGGAPAVNPPEAVQALDSTVVEEVAPAAIPAPVVEAAPAPAAPSPAAPPAAPAKTRRTAKVVQDELDNANQQIAALELKLEERTDNAGGEELAAAQAQVAELTQLLEAAQAAMAAAPPVAAPGSAADKAIVLQSASTDELLTAMLRKFMTAQRKAAGSL